MKRIALSFAAMLLTTSAFAGHITTFEYAGKGFTSGNACDMACVEKFGSCQTAHYTGEYAWQEKFFGKFVGWCNCQVVKEGNEGPNE